MYPRIQGGLCERCGVCVEICPSEVYRMGSKGVKIAYPDACIECGACVAQCPVTCVSLIDEHGHVLLS
jgi:NAD-dependent dihydropyrimidine dehydrogenase PreA subunit